MGSLNRQCVTQISIAAFLSFMGVVVDADAAALVIGANTAATVTTANDTWDIDGSVGGNGATLTFDTSLDIDAQLTVTSQTGGNSNAILNTVTVANDGNGDDTNTLIVGDGINAINLTIKGDVAGDFTTDSADLSIIINTDDGSPEVSADTKVSFEGAAVNLGTGSITLREDIGSAATVQFSGSVAQTVTGIIKADSERKGILSVTNTHSSGVTFNSAVGENQLDQILIGDVDAHTGSVVNFKSTVSASAVTIGTDGVGGSTSSTANFYDTATASLGFVFGDADGDLSADANTARFVSGNHDYTVTGDFSAADEADSNWIFVEATGTHQVTFVSTIEGVDRIWLGNDGEANVTAEFQDNVTVNDIMLGKVDGQTITLRFGSGGDLAIEGTIQKGGGNPTNNIVIYSLDNDSDSIVGFSNAVADISDITIGEISSRAGGYGIFDDTVNTAALTITAADTSDDSASVGEFNGALTVTGTITLVAGDSDAEDASAFFADDASAGSMILHADQAHGADATITVNGDGSQTITGTIDGAGDGQGDIVVIDPTNNAVPQRDTFASTIGGTYRLHSIAVGSDSRGGNALFSGSVSATSITVTSGDDEDEDSTASFVHDVAGTVVLDDGSASTVATISFDGTSRQTITGSINAAAAGEGRVIFNNDSTVSGNLGETLLNRVTVAADAVLTIGAKNTKTAFGAENIGISGVLSPLDTLVMTSGSTLTFEDGSTLAISDKSVLGDGEAFIDARTHGGTVIVGSVERDRITVTVPSDFMNGSIRLLDAGGDASYTGNGTFYIAQSDIAEYSVVNNHNVISVVALPKSASVLANVLHTSEQRAEGLRAGIIAATDDAEASHAYAEALTAGGAEAAKAIEQSSNAPTALSAAGAVGGNTVVAAANTIVSHIADIRAGMGAAFASGGEETGVSAGGMQVSEGKVMWIKPFYSSISQKGTNTLSGYEADISGLVAGMDVYQNSYMDIGVAFGYAKTNIDGKGSGNDKTDIAGYQFMAYGSYTMPSWYVDVLAGYGINDSRTERYINFEGLDRIASGEYRGQQYVIKADGGVPLEVAKDTFVTPLLGVHYVYLTTEDYLESGAGVLNLHVDTHDMDMVQTSLGMRLHTIVPVQMGRYIPYVQLGAGYEFMDNALETTSYYANGGSAFRVIGHKPQQVTKRAGAGLRYEQENVSVGLEYEAEFQHHYLSSTALGEVRFAF